jgi:DNA mismatch repair protein MutL
MSAPESPPRRAVKVLRESVARRIAAGEVIERPASVVRELLDNAIDAGSREISVHVDGGGLERIRVVDDGCGMTEADLRLCRLPHATSKIETEDDLQRITSLGFRGEALSSITTVSRTEIISRTGESDTAFKLTVHGGDFISLVPCTGNRGTIADISDLFYAIPARRRFMKRPSAETAQCGAVFIEKALPFPEISFKFFTEGGLRRFLPAGDLLGRIAAAHSGDVEPRFLHYLKGTGDGFSLEIAAMTPDLSRRDRKLIQIYINRRRIWEYSLVQGVEYVYGDYLPGGRFPTCFVFLDISPDLVDFNIHPAKKEAKIKNLSEIRRRITEVLASFLRESSRRIPNREAPAVSGAADQEEILFPGPSPGGNGLYTRTRATGQDLRLHEDPPPKSLLRPSEGYDFIYRGQVFGLFLIAERGDRLYLVDQHAAHERIVYDSLLEDTRPQGLLIPEEFETDDETDPVTVRNVEEIRRLGIEIRPAGLRRWALVAVPETFRGSEGEIIDAVTGHHGAEDTLKKRLFADIACKKAVKDGDPVDPTTACEIVRRAFAFENPRCPHGRPLWFEVSREELFRKVGRIV